MVLWVDGIGLDGSPGGVRFRVLINLYLHRTFENANAELVVNIKEGWVPGVHRNTGYCGYLG